MCISILSTSHPSYPFILISNRDEFIARPTLRANWWDSPYDYVMGGRDLQREERGTWLGITKQGRIAILTNFREEGEFSVNPTKSRGGMVNSYLCVPPDSKETQEEYVQRLMRDVGIRDVGGFTMIFGKLRKPRATELKNGEAKNHNSEHISTMPGLALVSNRTENSQQLKKIATTLHETHGVSNSHFGDTSWPKVVRGEQLLKKTIQSSKSEGDLITNLLGVLCTDSLPKRKSVEDWEMYVYHMRKSIMIPPAKGQVTEQLGADELRSAGENLGSSSALLQVGRGAYGTSKQTVILVNWEGKVTLVERTLYDHEGMPVPENERDLRYEFTIEGWDALDEAGPNL